MDIDICVVSETHLKADMSDAIVNIYQITRFSDETGTGLALIKDVKEELQST